MKKLKKKLANRRAVRDCMGKMSKREKKKRVKEMQDAYDKQLPGLGRKHMRIRRFLAAAGIAGLTFSALAVPGTGTASANTVPVIYNYANGWGSPTVRPQWVTIGQGGSPGAHTWYWNTWNTTTAKSTGTLWVNNCIPNCALGKTSYHKLYVTLYWVKSHNGTRYFYGMKWYTPGWNRLGLSFGKGWTSTVWLHFSIRSGGSAPYWH